MTSHFVVDTNVGVVANSIDDQYDAQCILSCVEKLKSIISSGRIVLDDKDLILEEYRKHLSASGQPGVGDAFMRWVFTNRWNQDKSEIVEITPNDGSFVEFPDDEDLTKFDPDDRKFVAVVLTSANRPKVQNAVDSDWWIFRDALKKHGIEVDFLCPDRIKQ
jgi:hypothetical protein